MNARRDDNLMPPLPDIWRARVLFMVALSLLCVVLLAPGTTQASCGSYLTLRLPGKNATQPGMPQTGFGKMSLAEHSGKSWPCSGPNCSNRKLLPPLPVVPSVRSLGDEVGGTATFTLTAEHSSAPLAESPSPHHPLQHPGSIFHPPRQSS